MIKHIEQIFAKLGLEYRTSAGAIGVGTLTG